VSENLILNEAKIDFLNCFKCEAQGFCYIKIMVWGQEFPIQI
jgi:hypothetical protein